MFADLSSRLSATETSYVAAPVFLSTGLGLLYILRLLVAPDWKTVLSFGGMTAAYFYTTMTGSFQELYIPLVVGIGLIIGSNVLDIIWRRKEILGSNAGVRKEDAPTTAKRHFDRISRWPNAALSKPFWDVSSRVGCIADTRFYIIVLALLSAELVLLFEGLSLLFWL